MLVTFIVSTIASIAAYIYTGSCLAGLVSWLVIGLLFVWLYSQEVKV